MFSEYLLSDNFESGRDAGYSRSGEPGGDGCLVMFVLLGSLFAAGLSGLAIAITGVVL